MISDANELSEAANDINPDLISLVKDLFFPLILIENEVNIEKHSEINHPEQKLLESEYLIIALVWNL